MFKPEFLLLPLLTAAVFCGDYLINKLNHTCSREKAVKEAAWWGGAFFVIGIIDLSSFSKYLA